MVCRAYHFKLLGRPAVGVFLEEASHGDAFRPGGMWCHYLSARVSTDRQTILAPSRTLWTHTDQCGVRIGMHGSALVCTGPQYSFWTRVGHCRPMQTHADPYRPMRCQHWSARVSGKGVGRGVLEGVQGHLAHNKQPPPKNLQ